MDYILICITTFLGSGLTLFSGFGLGTLLVPIFGLFFPIDLAIALTAIVHFLNNLFKFTLLGKKADKYTLISFGLPSIFAAFLGAYLLTYFSDLGSIFQYTLFDRPYLITPLKLIIAVILIFFAVFDLSPKLSNIQIDKKYLPFGGILSGFFGGLSGNQGALRSAFLIRLKLSKESFIATSIVIACLIDISRLTVYSSKILSLKASLDYELIIAATFSAFLGAYLANKLLYKITIITIQYIVAVFLIIFSILLALGII